MFRVLNGLLGIILLTPFFIPLIALATLSRLFNFIDFLYRGQIARALLSVVVSPFTAFATAAVGILTLFQHGWQTGFVSLISTFPTRVRHFFTKQLTFGRKEGEFVNELFTSSGLPSGLSKLVTQGFFGKLTLKLLSLCIPIDHYLSYDAKTVSPHNDVSLYFTEKNLTILKQKYAEIEREQSAQIVMEINQYLAARHMKADQKIAEVRQLPLSDDTRSGRLQSARDDLDAVNAAQRCVAYFTAKKATAMDLSKHFQSTSATVLNYIWLAIKSECLDEQCRDALKVKLLWTLFQIQRGFNIVNDGGGNDLPECPTAAIGLLVRVICDEQDKMPTSEYTAADPSPANLSLALKSALDRPFISSSDLTSKLARIGYAKYPTSYKQDQKDSITNTWCISFRPLVTAGVLRENDLRELVDAGVDAWEPPPEEQSGSQALMTV